MLYLYICVIGLLCVGCSSTPSVTVDLPPVRIQQTTNDPPGFIFDK